MHRPVALRRLASAVPIILTNGGGQFWMGSHPAAVEAKIDFGAFLSINALGECVLNVL